MTPRYTPAETARFTAAVHRREAAVRAASPFAHQREFAVVLVGWADDADARADRLKAVSMPQGDLFAAREGVTLGEEA